MKRITNGIWLFICGFYWWYMYEHTLSGAYVGPKILLYLLPIFTIATAYLLMDTIVDIQNWRK